MSDTQRGRRLRLSLLAAPALAATASVVAAAPAPAATTESLYNSSSPVGAADSDTGSVNLGVRFTPTVNGSVSAVDFYRGTTVNTAKYVDLWDASTKSRIGRGTLSSSLTTGWTRVALSSAVKVAAGHTYIASVLAPVGRYNAINWGFTSGRTVGDLSVSSNAGVYTYSGSEAYPSSTWDSSEYLVSPVFAPSGTTSTTSPTPTPTSTATASPTPTNTATATPTPTNTATATPTPTSTATASPSSSTSTSNSSTACTNPQWSSSAAFGQWSNNGFLVNNNEWSSEAGPQTIYACGANSWYVNSNQPELTSDPGSVKTYPDTEETFSERAVSSFSTLSSSFDETSPGVGEYDFAYDIWLNNWANEVMVWNDYRGQAVPPYGSNAITVTVDGTSYYAWHRTGYIALARVSPAKSGTVDVRNVLNWLIGQGWLPNTSTLTAVEYGVEISSTGGSAAKFSVNNYSLTAN